MPQDLSRMSNEQLLAARDQARGYTPAFAPAPAPAPASAPAPARASAPSGLSQLSNEQLLALRDRQRQQPAAPAAPRRAPTGGGRQPAPTPARAAPPAMGGQGSDTGALTREDSVRAFMDQGYPADVALQKAVEQEQYDEAVRPYTLPDGRVVNLRGPGTPVAMAGTQRPDDIVVDGMLYRKTEYEPAVELPAAEVQGGVEGLPMVPAAAPQGSLLDQAVAGARQNPVLGTIMGLGVGAAGGVNDILGGAVRLGGNAMSYIPGLGDFGRGVSQNANEFLAAVNQRVDAERANAGLGGAVETARFAGQMFAPMPIVKKGGQLVTQGGEAIGAFAPDVGASLQRIGQGFQAGGMVPLARPIGAPPPSVGARLGALGENMLAGAGNAAISSAALPNQDVGLNTAIGAALPVVARPAAAIVGATLSQGQKIFDPTGYGTRTAANVVRRAIGPEDYDAALTALRNAPEGVTAQQVLAETGLPVDVFMALGDIGVRANPRAYRLLSDAQEAARVARLTPAQNAVNAGLARVQQQQFRTTQAGEQMVEEALANQRAIPREGTAALEDLRVGAEEASDYYAASRVQAQRTIDEMAGGATLTAARTSQAAARQALRDATAGPRAELLAAADASGALTVAPISARLMQMADAPGVSIINRPVLMKVAMELDAMAARRGGVASADDVYTFRKDLGDIVSKVLNSDNVTSQRARQAIDVRGVQTQIDAQIEEAIRAVGGPPWQSYLDTYSAGMRALEQQELMGVAGWMSRQNPKSFQNLVRGESPDAVADIFGSGRIDLAETLTPEQLTALRNAADVLDQEADIAGRFASQTAETTRGTARAKTEADIALEDARARAAKEASAANAMAGDVTAQNAMALQQVQDVNAGELSRDQRVRIMATQGGAAARDLLNPRRPLFGRARVAAAATGSVPAGAMMMASELIDAKVSQQTQQALARAYASGASMADLIAITPVNERGIISQILANPQFWGAAARGAVPAAAGVINSMGGQPANTMSPAPQ